MRNGWLRAGLAVLTASSATVGVWALAAPRSFFEDFPGGGRAWVAALPPYNEHLVRDVGGLYLALAVLLGAAAVKLGRTLVRTALVAALATGVPHLVFHLANSGGMDAADRVAQSVGLAFLVALPLALFALTIPGSGEA